MKLFGIIICILLSVIISVVQSGLCPIFKPDVITNFNLQRIPQFHCLRYFKHDFHLLKRCRNFRMLKRPLVNPDEPIKE
ncbi:CLUMA_CG014185, isoform A [Clunio marinus]|uniref:CLUMA_CG014185, isoform A n=1 Tax=Clunio marinus TaxID=568069 RepID=A0A1J1ISR2_9DIPT|nr:CLUMA_CG014185, isoform A [Clunio marinus]